MYSSYMFKIIMYTVVPSGAVTDLDAINIGTTTVKLSWGPVMDGEQNGNITSYNVYYRSNLSSRYMVIRNVMDMVCMCTVCRMCMHTYV